MAEFRFGGKEREPVVPRRDAAAETVVAPLS